MHNEERHHGGIIRKHIPKIAIHLGAARWCCSLRDLIIWLRFAKQIQRTTNLIEINFTPLSKLYIILNVIWLNCSLVQPTLTHTHSPPRIPRNIVSHATQMDRRCTYYTFHPYMHYIWVHIRVYIHLLAAREANTLWRSLIISLVCLGLVAAALDTPKFQHTLCSCLSVPRWESAWGAHALPSTQYIDTAQRYICNFAARKSHTKHWLCICFNRQPELLPRLLVGL